jgi:hypothetical protein
MGYVVTNAYRSRVAQNIAGVSPRPDIVPAFARLGSGRYNSSTGQVTDPTPTDTNVQNPIPGYTNVPVSVSVEGNSARVQVLVLGGASPVNVTEIGIFTADGTPVILDSFRPVTLQSPMALQATYIIYPEV